METIFTAIFEALNEIEYRTVLVSDSPGGAVQEALDAFGDSLRSVREEHAASEDTIRVLWGEA